jgi:hypothetical protein
MTILVIFVNKYKDLHYKVEVFRQEQGWGYDIVLNRKTIIHQAYIPAISGNKVFEYKSSAKKAGELVVKKLNNKKSPRITKEELSAILKK